MTRAVPKVSVIIPSYQREDSLKQTVSHLLKQSYPDFEIVIVAQGKQAYGLKHDKIRVFNLEKANLPRARNFGVRVAKGEIILFLDDDITPSRHLIAQHAGTLGDGIDAVVGRVLDTNNTGSKQKAIQFDPRTAKYISDWGVTQMQDAVSVIGCNFSAYKHTFEKIKFDDFFNLTAHWEEADFAFRLRALGGRIVFQPSARLVHHMVPGGGCHFMPRFVFHYSQFKNATLFYFKHCPLLYVHRFLIAQKNLLEYQSRKPDGRHEKDMILTAALGTISGIFVFCLESLFFRSRLPKKRYTE